MITPRVVSVALTIAILVVTAGCKGKSPTAPPGGSGSGTPPSQFPELRVSYAGFVGLSFTASDVTPCPTAACSIAAPVQTVRQAGTYSYQVSPGTYRLDGTLNGRPAPLTPPATNVSAALAFSFTWQVISTTTLLGIDRNSLRLNGNPVSPTDEGGTVTGCGRYLESFNPSQVIQWSYTFTVVQYSQSSGTLPNICV
jgi:hypothetical protein